MVTTLTICNGTIHSIRFSVQTYSESDSLISRNERIVVVVVVVVAGYRVDRSGDFSRCTVGSAKPI